MARTITSANSVYLLAISSLYPVPQQLQGFAAEAAFETESIEPAQVVMGVDGRMSAGYVPVVNMQTVTLQADSASCDLFESWLAIQKTLNDVLYATGTIIIPGTGKKYALTQGVLSGIVQVPAAHKILQPRAFKITWADISPAVA